MPDFFPEIEIQKEQAEAIARGLFAVAKADGTVHDREAAIIAEFFGSTTTSAADLGALERAPIIDGATLAAFLTTVDLRKLFLKTAVLLAYADSSYGANEQKIIGEYAKALEVGTKDLELLELQVKEFLLSQLAHLSNVQAAAQVAKELKLT
jgi:tellurite resistance protein